MRFMKRRYSPALVVATLSLAFAGGAYAQDAAKGASLMTAARTALGGEDKLRAVKTLEVKSDFKRTAGQNTLEGDLELRIERPGKMRRDEDLSLPGGGPSIIRTEVLNGAEVWDENSGAGGFGGFGGGGGRGFGGGRGRDQAGRAAGAPAPARAIDPVQLKELQHRTRQADLSRFNLMWLLDTDAPVAWVGTAESPDGKADVLEITPAESTPMRLFLDQVTHMPLMVTWQGTAGPGGRRGRGDQAAQPGAPAIPPTQQLTLGEYKAVNGIKLPHHITRGANGQTIEEWTVKSYKLNPSFKSDVFNK